MLTGPAARKTAEWLLGQGRKPAGPAYTHQPSDIGWIIHRHGVLSAEENGLDMRFEALVVKIAAGFIENFDVARERCWIAERGGAVVGAVLPVKEGEAVAKLRLLYVESSSRGPVALCSFPTAAEHRRKDRDKNRKVSK